MLTSAVDLAAAVRRGERNVAEVAETALAQTDLLIGADGLGAFLHVDGTAVRRAAAVVQARVDAGEDLPLAGVPVALKDNIAHKGQPLGCASLALRDHRATYSATAVTRLQQAGAIIIGRTNMDEHAMGSSTERSAYHTTLNPWDPDRVPGGSSGGSAAAVAVGAVPLALGSDTGGSVRQPAAFCGVVGLRPTWGRISRSGLVAFASSMDTIGPLTRTVADTALALQVMAGADDADATTRQDRVPDYLAGLSRDLEGVVIGVLLEGLGNGVDAPVKARFNAGLTALEARGASLRPVSVTDLRHAVTTYQVLAAAEAASNLARYDGTAFGTRVSGASYQEMVRHTRTQTLGTEVKRRIMLGTFLLSTERARGLVDRARAMRAHLSQQLRHLLVDCDVLASPTTPTVAFRFGERTDDPVAMYLADSLTTPATVAGLPALSVPVGMADLGLGDRMPAGLQLIGRPWEEGLLLALGQAVEDAIPPPAAAPTPTPSGSPMKLLFLALMSLACLTPDSKTDPNTHSTGSTDAGSTDAGSTDAGSTDAGSTDAGSTDAGSTDAGSTDAGSTTGLAGTRFVLTDDTEVRGQIVASYDHSLWWDASDQTTWAVFDPALYAAYPAGRSLRFVSSLDVASQHEVDLGTPTPYVEFLRDQDIVIGALPIDGPAYVIMGNEDYHLEEDGYGNYAWDLVLTDDAGVRYTGPGVANEDFLVWGQTVSSPVSGLVVEIVRSAVDNRPGSYPDDAVNNMIGIGLGGHYYLYLYHFQQNSIPSSLHVGDAVTPGTFLGLVGNSGVTLEPHLHLTALYLDVDPVSPSLTARSWSVPSEWAGMWSSDSPTGPATAADFLTPTTASWIDDAEF